MEEIKKRVVKKEEFYVSCNFPRCNAEFKGISPARVRWNFLQHRREKHPQDNSTNMSGLKSFALKGEDHG